MSFLSAALPAIISTGASLLGGNAANRAAQNASAQQQAGLQRGINLQQSLLSGAQSRYNPFITAGQGGVSSWQNLLGAGTPEAQTQAINQISGSPEMQALQTQGENALLQHAAATGGLRGGNLESALALYRPQLLTDLINQHIAGFQGLANLGLGAAGQLGQQEMGYGGNLANLYSGQAGAQAAGTLAQGANTANMFNSLGGLGSSLAGNLLNPTSSFDPYLNDVRTQNAANSLAANLPPLQVKF